MRKIKLGRIYVAKCGAVLKCEWMGVSRCRLRVIQAEQEQDEYGYGEVLGPVGDTWAYNDRGKFCGAPEEDFKGNIEREVLP